MNLIRHIKNKGEEKLLYIMIFKKDWEDIFKIRKKILKL